MKKLQHYRSKRIKKSHHYHSKRIKKSHSHRFVKNRSLKSKKNKRRSHRNIKNIFDGLPFNQCYVWK